MRLRLCIGPNAFGNALGNSIGDSLRPDTIDLNGLIQQNRVDQYNKYANQSFSKLPFSGSGGDVTSEKISSGNDGFSDQDDTWFSKAPGNGSGGVNGVGNQFGPSGFSDRSASSADRSKGGVPVFDNGDWVQSLTTNPAARLPEVMPGPLKDSDFLAPEETAEYVVRIPGKDARLKLAIEDAGEARLAEYISEINQHNRQVMEQSRPEAGFGDSPPLPHPITTAAQEVAKAKYIVDNLLSKKNWRAVGTVLEAAAGSLVDRLGKRPGAPSYEDGYFTRSVTPEEASNAAKAVFAVPGFFEKELGFLGMLPMAGPGVRAASGVERNIGESGFVFNPAAKSGISFESDIVRRTETITNYDLSTKQRLMKDGTIQQSEFTKSWIKTSFDESSGHLYIENMEAQVGHNIGREMISNVIEAIGPQKIKSIGGEFAYTNRAAFEGFMGEGLSATDAARLTPFGKALRDLGYDRYIYKVDPTAHPRPTVTYLVDHK